MPGGIIGVDDRPARKVTGTSPEAESLIAADAGLLVPKDNAPGDTSDGYHTFDELYEHRLSLTAVIATIAAIDGDSWRSKRHHPADGPMFDGYFIVGIDLPGGQVSYHHPLKDWDRFAEVPVLEHAPRWDGHTSDDAQDRLHAFVLGLNEAIRAGRRAQAAARTAADKASEGVVICRFPEEETP